MDDKLKHKKALEKYLDHSASDDFNNIDPDDISGLFNEIEFLSECLSVDKNIWQNFERHVFFIQRKNEEDKENEEYDEIAHDVWKEQNAFEHASKNEIDEIFSTLVNGGN